MWYSNVLIELFQIVVTTSQQSEKCLRKYYVIAICLETFFGTANLQLFQPIS
jgi:hypothetical protein